jgi:allantoinase
MVPYVDMPGQPQMLTGPRLLLRSRRVFTPAGPLAGGVLVREGRIEAVLGESELAADHRLAGVAELEDLGDAALMPGLIDPHVHCEDPGRTEWEGFAHATAAAAAGGITTLVDMPIDCDPVTTIPAAVEAKRAAAAGRCRVDVRLWGGLVPKNAAAAALDDLLDAGVAGIKAFLIDSGLEDFPAVGEAELHLAMPVLARRQRPLLAHAELPDGTTAPMPASRRYADYEASRPPSWELDAIRLLVRLCRQHRCPVHIVHLSSAAALPMLAAARAEGLPITVETCPHYLTFAAEDIADGATLLKCAPPIRGRDNREALWQGLRDGVIDLVACDHSPCLPAMRAPDSGDFATAWAGIASLQLSLPALWTEARQRGFRPEQLVPWLCAAPARLAGLAERKGAIAPGQRADLVAWLPESRFTCDPARLFLRNPQTPYTGRELYGEVLATWLGGQKIFARGALCGPPQGQVLLA